MGLNARGVLDFSAMSLFSPAMLGRYLRNAIAVKRGDEPFGDPLVVTFEITERTDSAAVADELSTADVRKLFDVIRPVCDAVSIVGGEPLVRADLEDVLGYARGLGMRVGLTTSAEGIDQRAVLDHVDQVTTTFEPARVDMLSRISKQKGFRVVVQAPIRRSTLASVRDVMEFCRAREVYFAPEPEVIGIWPSPELQDNAEYRALIDEIAARKQRGERIASTIGFLEGVRDFRKFTCHPGLSPRVRPTGDVYYPCAALQKIAGNVVQVGDWNRTMAEGRAKHGPVPDCGNHCHVACTMNGSLAVRQPVHALREGWYGVRRALRSGGP